jgi:hypothetical protein
VLDAWVRHVPEAEGTPEYAAAREGVARQFTKLSKRPRRPGRRGHDPAFYAALAIRYEQWLETGDKLAVLAKRMHLTESGTRAALHVARSKGFLTETQRGVAGGVATPKAYETIRNALEENSDDGEH